MKGQPEREHDLGIGKKLDTKTPEPDWYARTGTVGVWRNVRTGKLETFMSPPARRIK